MKTLRWYASILISAAVVVGLCIVAGTCGLKWADPLTDMSVLKDLASLIVLIIVTVGTAAGSVFTYRVLTKKTQKTVAEQHQIDSDTIIENYSQAAASWEARFASNRDTLNALQVSHNDLVSRLGVAEEKITVQAHDLDTLKKYGMSSTFGAVVIKRLEVIEKTEKAILVILKSISDIQNKPASQ